MATRQSMTELLQRCNEVIAQAEEQCNLANRQEHYNEMEFTTAQQELEGIYNDLHTMDQSASQQQREELHRMRLLVEKMQNEMTVRLY